MATTTKTARWEVRRRHPLIPIGVAVVGLAALVYGFEVPHRHRIEDNLTDRTKVALADAGIDATVRFTGRDGSVTVESQDQVEQARSITLGLDGVRVVKIDAPPKVEAPPQPVSVKLLLDAGKVVLTGAVPDESAHTALVDAAKAAFGADNVQDQVTVDAKRTAGSANLAALGGVVAALGKDTKVGVVDLTDGTVTLTGTVASQEIKDKAETAAKAVASTVRNQLVVGAAVAPEQVQTQLGALPTVEFENNSATLTAQGQAVVANVASILKTNPTVRVSIEGHTDSRGTPERNQVLSEARARTVLDTLIALGIAPDRLTSRGFGESQPKVPGTDDASNAINRRVEFIVQK
ncbi:OmpA family protein [Dactylosporangium sp. AC04546]|uniref:OmpA family protein n=1 Tax=Dactylosporangium sp. AC04546 TaxID=2862460 RepID=UPI001EDE55E3|nr:OmpA family protein [Dactylosporangium sp. AC04546]WVK83697.1 OmpA family protein [Dactylosporangium sp. AC04546]